MPDAPHGELGHVAERDPADRPPARAEDLRRALREIEAERGTEPHLHEHAGAQNRVGQTALLQVPLDAPLRRAKRALHFEVPGERHVDELADAGPPRGIDELQLAVLVRSEEHTSELQSLAYLVCRLLLEKKNRQKVSGCLRTLTGAKQFC